MMLVFLFIFKLYTKIDEFTFLLLDNLIFLENMARAMFEYTKIVLQKVSFNSELFCIELEKALKRLLPFEVEELTIWIKQYTANKPELYVCLNLIE